MLRLEIVSDERSSCQVNGTLKNTKSQSQKQNVPELGGVGSEQSHETEEGTTEKEDPPSIVLV